jgi:hypothetical protein
LYSIANTVAEQRRDRLCAWGDACGWMVSECNGFRSELCTFLCDTELEIKKGKQVLAKERRERKKARMREYNMKQLRQKKKKERET